MFETTASQIFEILQKANLLKPGQKSPENWSQVKVQGVSTDSRTLSHSNLFIPLAGPNFNGHKFIAGCLEQGACLCLSEEKEFAERPKVLGVQSTLLALQELARWWRLQAAPKKVIGVVGSNGKTSTKNFIQACLATSGKTQATRGNLNNHIGVAQTLLSLPKALDYAIIEMGINHPGELGPLAKMAKPDFAVLTGVGREHLEGLGSLEQVIEAELEILQFLPQQTGFLIVNLNDPMLATQLQNTAIRVTSISSSPSIASDWQVIARQSELNCLQVELRPDSGTANEEKSAVLRFKLPCFGIHMAENASLALLVCKKLGVPTPQAEEALSLHKAAKMRCELKFIPEQEHRKLILDCYNANPESMLSLFATLDTYAEQNQSEKIWLILGDMYELGDTAPRLHSELGKSLNLKNYSRIVTLGPLMEHLHQELIKTPGVAKDTLFHARDHGQIRELLLHSDSDWTLLALKASRGVTLEKSLPEQWLC